MTHDYVSYDYDYDYEADTNTVYVFSNAFQKKVSFQAANFEPRHPLHRLKQDTRPYHTISMLMCVYMSSIMSINLCRETIWFTASPSKSMKQKNNWTITCNMPTYAHKETWNKYIGQRHVTCDMSQHPMLMQMTSKLKKTSVVRSHVSWVNMIKRQTHKQFSI